MCGEFSCQKMLKKIKRKISPPIIPFVFLGICKLNNEQQSLSTEILLLLGNQKKGNSRKMYFIYEAIVPKYLSTLLYNTYTYCII